VIVMTSNLGSQMIQQMAGDDYQVDQAGSDGRVQVLFPAGIINRIDEVVFSTRLTRSTSNRSRKSSSSSAEALGCLWT